MIEHPISALFETMSGFTTTGASGFNWIWSRCRVRIHFWRALTNWFGGMGVLVLCVWRSCHSWVGGMQIFRAEMPPGLSKDRLTATDYNNSEVVMGGLSFVISFGGTVAAICW